MAPTRRPADDRLIAAAIRHSFRLILYQVGKRCWTMLETASPSACIRTDIRHADESGGSSTAGHLAEDFELPCRSSHHSEPSTMKLIKLSIAAVAGGLLANALLKGRQAGAAGQDDSAPSGASDSSATQRSSSGRAGTESDSPNPGERLTMGQAVVSLTDPDPDLGLGSPNADGQEPVRSPGLSNYSLGA